MKYALLKQIQEGVSLLPVVKHISQDKINCFSVVSDATEAVHVDPEYARNSPIKTTLANGFMSYGYICEVMENNFGIDWMVSGELEVRFIGAIRPGDSVVVGGIIERVAQTEEGLQVNCKVNVCNQAGDECVVGSTSLVCTKN